MAKPSIFSRDYERKMKRRKRNITIVAILAIIIFVALFIKFEVANADFSNLRSSIQAWVDSGKPEEEPKEDTNKEEEVPEPVEEKPKDLSYDFTTPNGSIIKAKYQESNGVKNFQGIEVPAGVTYSLSPSMTKVVIIDQNQNVILGNIDGTTKDLSKYTYTDKRGNVYNKDEILAKYPENIWCNSIKFIDDNTLIYFSNLPYVGAGVQDKYFWMMNTETMQEQMLTGLIGTNVSIGNLDSVNGIEVSVNGYNYYIKADGSCVQKDDIGANSQYNTGLNGQYSQETNENNY